MGSHGIKDRVAIVGMGCTPFGEHWHKSTDDLLIDSTSDAFSLTFNEAMNTTTAGVSIQVSDNDPTTVKTSATLSCGSGAGTVTCVWNTAATVLTVTSNGGRSVSSPTGTTPGLQLPLTITATTGLKDTDDGVAPNLSASDKTID